MNYSIRTEDAYVDWVRRFVLFHSKRHPHDMSATEVKAFLTHLAVGGQVAAATQNQAKAALLFLYRQVLGLIELAWLGELVHSWANKPLPVVLTRDEVRAVLDRMTGTLT